MITALILILFAASFYVWFSHSNRLATIEARSGETASLERQVSQLAGRVYRVEQSLAAYRVTPAIVVAPPEKPVEPTKQHTPEATVAAEEPPPLPETKVTEQDRAVADQPIFPGQPQGQPEFVAPPSPSLSDKIRAGLGNNEWEALVGGSILNKLGALVLVVGIALFLAYSFTYMTPAGRAAIAAVLSLALIASGIFIERRQTYRVFARGLIGGGWAALYATTYAMYALPAAQIIANPFIGSVLLLVVAAGMIAHSLRYRAQTITSLAFFAAFAALAATPSTPFAVVALVPLAASLLYLAWRFEWYAMAIFGLVATYGTGAWIGVSGTPLLATETLLVGYWLMFELFDLLRLRRGSKGFDLTWLFPLNAIAFLALSYNAWQAHDTDNLWKMAAFAAALFLATALARVFLRAKFEAPLTVAAVLAGLAIFGRAEGLWAGVGIAAEAELLYLAGARFNSSFLRLLGFMGFAISLSDVAWRYSFDLTRSKTLFGFALYTRTPALLLHATLFYLNRALRPSARLFSYLASALIALVILTEIPGGYAGLALLPFALVLFELGMRTTRSEFRYQAYASVALGTLSILATHSTAFEVAPARVVWISTLGAAIAFWFLTSRAIASRSAALASPERETVLHVTSFAGTAFMLLTLWMLLLPEAVAVAWIVLAISILEIGFALSLPSLQVLGSVVTVMVFGRLFGTNLYQPSKLRTLATCLPILAAFYYVWVRLRQQKLNFVSTVCGTVTIWLAGLLAVALIGRELDHYWVAAGLALLSLILQVIGVFWRIRDLRWQSYALGIPLAFQCLIINLISTDPATRLMRITATAFAIAALFAIQFFLRSKPAPEPYAKNGFSILAVFLLTGLLFNEVSGGLLTVACGLEGIILLTAGLISRERILRLQGLLLLLSCILKLFLYDLRNLETLYRILSFIALGIILLAVSWIYTRFRDRLRQFL